MTGRGFRGTEFVVRIPQLVKNKVAISTLGSSFNKAKKNKYEATFEAKGAKILVVDDVKLNLKVIKDQALKDGMSTLRMSATRYVLNGITSITEMKKVSFDE